MYNLNIKPLIEKILTGTADVFYSYIICYMWVTFLFQEKQDEVLGFGSTWFSLWLWKVMSADAFMHYTLIAVFFGKLWVSF